MELRCAVTSLNPLSCTLEPDRPSYRDCDLAIDYTDALLSDLGPVLLMLYASLAGPPITRDALIELVEPIARVRLEHSTRDEVLVLVRSEYAPVLARGRERVAALR